MKYVIVDCENVSHKVTKGFMSIPNTRFIFIVGAGQSSSSYNELNPYKVVKCPDRGKNAADFVVMSVVTEILAKTEDSMVLILSNDTGFDPAIHYLMLRGFNVGRVSTADEIKSDNIVVYRLEKQLKTISNLNAQIESLNLAVQNAENKCSIYKKQLQDINSKAEYKKSNSKCMIDFYNITLEKAKSSMNFENFKVIQKERFGSNAGRYINMAIKSNCIKVKETKYGVRIYFSKQEILKEIDRIKLNLSKED